MNRRTAQHRDVQIAKFSDLEAALWKSLLDEKNQWSISEHPSGGTVAIHRAKGLTVSSAWRYEGSEAGAFSGKFKHGDVFADVWHRAVSQIHAERTAEADQVASKTAETDLRRRAGL